MEIQAILREEMKESTVITIAHRLEAVKNADYCIVLHKGGVLAQGPAEEMLRSGTAQENVQSTEDSEQVPAEQSENENDP
jgi:ABC-type multidrug transport system fused ATPase/permease subunit